MKILRKIYQNDLLTKFLSFSYVLLQESHDRWKYNGYKCKYNIDPTFKFRGTGIIFFGKGNITIKENSYIVRYSILESCANCKIIIGKNCAIGPYVKLIHLAKKQ